MPKKYKTKPVSLKCESKFESRLCNSDKIWNSGKCRCECKNTKNIKSAKKILIGILLHVVAKMVNI